METNKTSNRIHPLMAAAAVSVMLVSLVGVAAITGVIPTSHGSATTAAVPAPAVAAAPITTPAPLAVAASAAAPSVDAKIAADKVVNPQPKRVAAAPAPRSYAPREPAPVRQQPRTYQHAEPVVVAQAPRTCSNCGRVESVQAIQQQAQPSGLGVVAGAVLGGVLGNQVGGGNGKKLATVAGAVGGGFAGNEVERRTRSTTAYEVRVRMDDGTVRTFPYNNQPNWSIGDRIRVVDGYLTNQA